MKIFILAFTLIASWYLISCEKDNQAPIIDTIKDQRINPDSVAVVEIVARDADADKLVFNIVGNPGFLSLSEVQQINNESNVFLTISPVVADSGNYTVTIEVTDGEGNTDTVSFNVEVFEDNFNYNKKIVYVSIKDNMSDIYIMNADGSDKKRLTTNENNDFDPSFSPDGTKIVYASVNIDKFSIWMMNSDGSEKIRLSEETSGVQSNPFFSADGTRIIYSSSSGFEVNIMIMNSDGTDPQTLLSDGTINYVEAVSPIDGKIAYISQRVGGMSIIFVMDLDGSDKTLLFGPIESLLSGLDFSPDGEKIIYTNSISYTVNNITYYNDILYTVDISSSLSTPLNLNFMGANFSPDGKKIVCMKRAQDIDFALFLMNTDGTHLRQLTATDQNNSHPYW